jgi:hypothetical protein
MKDITTYVHFWVVSRWKFTLKRVAEDHLSRVARMKRHISIVNRSGILENGHGHDC